MRVRACVRARACAVGGCMCVVGAYICVCMVASVSVRRCVRVGGREGGREGGRGRMETDMSSLVSVELAKTFTVNLKFECYISCVYSIFFVLSIQQTVSRSDSSR